MASHYDILGVQKTASLDEIKKAYRTLARTRHPDKAKSEEEKKRMEDEFAAMTTAYNILKDAETRETYDQTLKPVAGKEEAEQTPGPGAAPSRAPAPAGAAPKIDLEKGRRDVAMRAYAQGVKLFQLGDYVRASDFLRAAVENQPEEAQFQDRLAVCLLRAKRNFTEAVAAAEKASELDPYKSDYRIHLAELYEAIGSKDRAKEAYREILKWDPTNVIAVAKVGPLKEGGESGFAKLKKMYLKLVGRDED